MIHALLPAALILPLAGGLLVYAALHDVAARTIPDSVTLGIALLGGILSAYRGGLAVSLAVAMLVFGLLASAWGAGQLGGGDVKLIPSATLLVPPSGVLSLLCAIAIAGGLVALSYLLLHRLVGRTARRRSPHPALGGSRPLPVRAWHAEIWRIRRRGPIPYAVGIAAGTLICLGRG